MCAKLWDLIKDTVSGFMEDEALSRAAAITYFTIFSLAPLLLIVTTNAGFGVRARGGAGRDHGPVQRADGQGQQRWWHRCCRALAAKASNPGRSRRSAESSRC